MRKSLLIVVIFVAAGILIGGCTHSRSKSQYVQNVSNISRMPAEFLLGNNFVDMNPANEMVFEGEDKKVVDCSKLEETTRKENYNGQEYIKYNVAEADQLSCPQIKEAQKKVIRLWKVKKVAWDSADETAYENFLKSIAASGCDTIDKCLSGAGNPLRTEEDMRSVFYTDCADFPYYLRAYFSYKRNLPMSYVLQIAQAPFTEAQIASINKDSLVVIDKARAKAASEYDSTHSQPNADEREYAITLAADEAARKYDQQVADLRYSRNGNIPVSRFSIPSRNPIQYDFGVIGARITDIISSGFLRMSSAPEGAAVQTDFYSPQIRPGIVKAGTTLYNVAGHVAVVYEVTAKGEVLFIDAHPDNSVTRGAFNLDYRVVKPAYGGNFKNFRPIKVINPTYDAQGVITTGQIVVANDNEIPEFSYEQYNGDSGKDLDGKSIFKLEPNDPKPAWDFVEWVKYRLSRGTYRLEPVVEMKKEVDALCSMVKNRVKAMQSGVDNGISKLAHPDNLPRNIWGADKQWESYSSPGSDIRLRNKMLSIPTAAKGWLARYRDRIKNSDRIISYNGTNLKADLIKAYQSASASCNISYKNSSGINIPLTLEQVIKRASLLSFDPYMCIEARWGATDFQELAACRDSEEKRDWYKYEQFLRNLPDKDNDAIQGYSLKDLKQMDANKSVDNSDASNRYNIFVLLQQLQP